MIDDRVLGKNTSVYDKRSTEHIPYISRDATDGNCTEQTCGSEIVPQFTPRKVLIYF
jgi:hypothetical protein